MNGLVPAKPPASAVSVSGNVVVPAVIAGAGKHAVRQPLTLISLGLYNEPKGVFLPSILY